MDCIIFCRFSQFFVAPLFDPDGTEREMFAVDSENKKNLKNDAWRLNQLEKSLSNPSHPYSKFGTGNLETLGLLPKDRGIEIRKILIEFYEKHYSANVMKLVVYGREHLDQLEVMIRDKFSKILNRQAKVPSWDGMPWTTEHFKQFVLAKTIKDVRTLYLTWELPEHRMYFKSKPVQYWSHLIGHEGEGTVVSWLKHRGWITGLSAGCDNDATGYSFFQVAVELSPQGMSKYHHVIKAIFAYIKLIKSNAGGPSSPMCRLHFEEFKKLENLSFRFREKGAAASVAHKLAGNMQLYPPEYVIAGPTIVEEFEPELIFWIGEYLTPDNFRVMLAAGRLQNSFSESWSREKWYGTEYLVRQLDPKFVEALKFFHGIDEEFKDLKLPQQNVFIPERLVALIPIPVSNPLRSPKRISTGSNHMIWHKADDVFAMPKTNVFMFLRTPIVMESPRVFVACCLWIEVLKDYLSDKTYPASISGLNLDMDLGNDGVEIRFYGFSDRMDRLIYLVMSEMFNFTKIEEVKFEVLKEQVSSFSKISVSFFSIFAG